MLAIFLKTLPFFLLIGLGYWAGRTRFFSEEATAYLTKFVFYFALSAMIFRFSSSLEFSEFWDGQLVLAYLSATVFVYVLAACVGILRGLDVPTIAIEAQCSVIGNVGFLGIPMLALLLGDAAVGPVILILTVDLIVFSSLIVILIVGYRDGRMTIGILRTIGMGLIRNPMIVSMSLGLLWSALQVRTPTPMADFLELLGAAATPGALFAIGASLASKSAERLSIAVWLSACKLFLHPLCVAVAVLYLFQVNQFSAGVVIAAAAMPVAGNVFILAQHYGVAPQRVSAAILVSTVISIVTLTGVIAWVSGFQA
ncbi:MAG: AEC family transporter [Paracoccaceae bacterium]